MSRFHKEIKSLLLVHPGSNNFVFKAIAEELKRSGIALYVTEDVEDLYDTMSGPEASSRQIRFDAFICGPENSFKEDITDHLEEGKIRDFT